MTCRRCGKAGSAPGDFYPCDRYVCKLCRKVRGKEIYDSRTDEQVRVEAEYHRNRIIRRKYDLSPEAFAAMAEGQEWKCAICASGLRGAGRQLQVDHCHKTRRVRALLCGPCNRALGNMRDDPVRLRSAADYVERHKNP